MLSVKITGTEEDVVHETVIEDIHGQSNRSDE
jgi:hypothetical protein